MATNALEYNGVSRISSDLPLRCECARRILRLIERVLFQVQVQGLEHVPAGNCIVVANHLSWVDPFILLLHLPPTPRIYIAGAKQAVREPWQARMMRWFDVLIPYERGARWMGKHPFAQSLATLKAGASLAVFVEGDAGPQEGSLMPVCRGVGHFLSRVQVPVLPVALSGTRELWWRKPIRMIVGEPFTVNMQCGNHRDAISAAVSQVEDRLHRLLPQYAEPSAGRKRLRRFLTTLGGPVQGMAFE